MAETTVLGRSEVRVSRLGLGVMIWGEASGLQRVMPAKSSYGAPDPAGEQAAFETSLAAEVTFFDTAAMYSAGGSERRLGELAEGKDVVIATKFPLTPLGRAQDLPHTLGQPEKPAAQLDRSLPTSFSEPSGGHCDTHGADGGCGRGRQDQSGGCQ